MRHKLFPTISLLGGLILLSACGPKNIGSAVIKQDLEEISRLMTGSFSSSAQAALDTNYYAISLHMYPIWPDAQVSYLYVEQAVLSTPTKPYRQRVYKVEQLTDGTYRSEVYKLKHDSLFINKWKTPSFFNHYSPDDLILREGCAVYLYRNSDGSYTGSTENQGCVSTMRGASYATSIVDIREDKISSWDQGFDAAGKQVWGAVNGPYIFKRIAERPASSEGPRTKAVMEYNKETK